MLGKLVQVLGNGTKFVAVLLSDHDQPSCPASHGVGQPSSEVIVIASPVLVLDHELGAVFSLRNDVDAPTAGRQHLRFSD